MVSFIDFSVDDRFHLPLYRVEDARYTTLGVWLITDLSIYFGVCLDGLAMLDDVVNGRLPFEEWSSDKFEVSITPEYIFLKNLWLESQHGRYPVDEVREALETYWRFLVSLPERKHLIREYHPGLPQWQADVLVWEETWGRPHPYRGRLF